jgi:hypothetical protein
MVEKYSGYSQIDFDDRVKKKAEATLNVAPFCPATN